MKCLLFAYQSLMWQAVAFLSCHRRQVLAVVQRQGSFRLKRMGLLRWFWSLSAASEQQAQAVDLKERIKVKELAHFFNEWRVVAVRQKDLRLSASTIAQQWEREISLKKKVRI